MVAVVTGATGVLGVEMAHALARSGAAVALLGRREEKARSLATEIQSHGAEALVLPADVLDKAQLEDAKDALLARWGRVDILVNAAGGNAPEATVGRASFFELPVSALRQVVDLNFLGTVLPCQVFGAAMAAGTENPEGCIVNVSSMTASRPLTNVVGYSAAKAAVENFTHWLAVELARPRPEPQGQRHSAGLLHRRAKQRDARKQRRNPHRAGSEDHGSHPRPSIRRPSRPLEHPHLPLQPRLPLRKRHRRPRRRRLQRLQRSMSTLATPACQHGACGASSARCGLRPSLVGTPASRACRLLPAPASPGRARRAVARGGRLERS
jgi:NADP-dependent 3-hydroxy acid dehydrogenase YdfG